MCPPLKTPLALALCLLIACGSESDEESDRQPAIASGDPELPVEGTLGAPFEHVMTSTCTLSLTGVLQRSRAKQHEGQPVLSVQRIGDEAAEVPILIRVVSPLKVEWSGSESSGEQGELSFRVGDTYEMVGHEEARLGGVNQEGVPFPELVSAPGRGYDHYFVASKITRVRPALTDEQAPR